jgi:ParB-like chromosome segregation protein Spo0J
VGSNARGIKPQGVKKLKTSIRDSGYARESIIKVKQASDGGCGKYLVIDGMHRVSALQELEDEKHTAVDYERVSKHAHAHTPLSHQPYC